MNGECKLFLFYSVKIFGKEKYMAIKTYKGLFKALNKNIDIAIENTAKILLEKLKEYINEDYYNLYEPIYYKPRTMKFLKSAVANITGKSTATIGIDKLYRSYQYPFGDWTGEEQTYMADAGFHGNSDIYRDGHFWKDFEQFCEENLIGIFKEELGKQGIKVK